MTTCELLIQAGTKPLRVYCPHCGYEGTILLPIAASELPNQMLCHQLEHQAHSRLINRGKP